MPKNLITILGVLIAILPFLGIPGSIKSPIYFLLGLAVAFTGYYQSHYKKKNIIRNILARKIRIKEAPVSIEEIKPPLSQEKNLPMSVEIKPREEIQTRIE